MSCAVRPCPRGCTSELLYRFLRQARDIEARFRRADEEKARLAADLRDAVTARTQLEQELRSVTKLAQEESTKWLTEKQRLNALLEARVGGGTGASGGPSQAAALVAVAAAEKQVATLKSEIDRLTGERETILRNWRNENDRMTMTWQQERQAWLAERDALIAKVRARDRGWCCWPGVRVTVQSVCAPASVEFMWMVRWWWCCCWCCCCCCTVCRHAARAG